MKTERTARNTSGQAQLEMASPQEYSSARFWRCALQVNPFNYLKANRGQDHGYDENAYNDALAQKCVDLGISVVGVADHGNVDSLDKLRDVLKTRQIVVFPGFEIASTEKIHMVCLFPEDTGKDQLNRYLGKLDLTDTEDGVHPSRLGCLDLATKVHELGGFWFAAHVTGNNGVLRLHKDGGGLPHIWREARCVRVAQIPGPIEDLPENYRAIVENRDVNYRRERPVTVINAKDVAAPEDLDNLGATTWVKMTRPSFEAFKIAFLDPGSRIRLHLQEEPHSALEWIRIQGGYLDGVEARFSEHLNALIGGRGTGKSTLIECLRYVLDLSPKGKQASKLHQDIVKENLGKESGSIELQVRSAAQHGASYRISRRYGEPPIVRDSSGAVSQQTPGDLLPLIEVYGQNEIFELAQDNLRRVQLLDRFLPIDSAGDEKRLGLRKKLVDNVHRLVKARGDLDELNEAVGRLPKLGEQLKGFQKLGIEAKLAKVPLFARERQLVQRVEQELERLESAVGSVAENLPDAAFLSAGALDNLPDASVLATIGNELEQLKKEVGRQLNAIDQVVRARKAAIVALTASWRTSVELGEHELEAAFASLPDMAGKSGREVGTAYRQLTQEIERIKPLSARKNTLTQLLADLEQERANLLAELSDARRKRVQNLQKAVDSLNARLQGKLRVRLEVEGDRSRLREFLAGCKLEGVGEKRLAWIEEKEVTPLALARSIADGAARLMSEYSITAVVADALAKLPYSKLLELQAVELSDRVGIQLNVAHGEEEVYRDLERLSTGQQCTAVLHLLLLENSDPLVVDQPEDNLDNAFIAERIVRELRDAKTRRQFLFSTHNANIPVFGDAEWIGVLTATDRHGILEPAHQGSIDVPYIREQAAEILEGGRAAFTQRKEMYEF